VIRRELPGEAVIRGPGGSALRKGDDAILAFPREILGDKPNGTAADAAVLDVFLALAAARIRKSIDPLAAVRALDFVVSRTSSHRLTYAWK
jgi:hypothetical protein